jgi:hypothetical protein
MNASVGFKFFDPGFIRLDHRIDIRFNQPVHQLFYLAAQLAYFRLKRLSALRDLRLPVIPPCFEHPGQPLKYCCFNSISWPPFRPRCLADANVLVACPSLGAVE